MTQHHRFVYILLLIMLGLTSATITNASETNQLVTCDNDSDDIVILQSQCEDPFCKDFKVEIELNRDASVEMSIRTPMGTTVKHLTLGHLKKGRHTIRWDGRDNTGHVVGSGVYVYNVRTQTDEENITLALLN